MSRRLNPKPQAFQESIGQELLALKDRVRHLIGDRHWGEEGGYKEALLRNVIKKTLPSHIDVASGFIVKESSGRIECSTQIDVIVYDSSYPVLFKEGDFIITTLENVLGIIEVKTKLRANRVDDTVNKAAEISKFVKRDAFNGIFSYETEIANDELKARFDKPLRSCQGSVTNICLGNDIFIHYFSQEELEGVRSTNGSVLSKFYGIYELKGLAFSYFIANLLDVVCSKNNPNLMDNRHWFLFPLETGKAPHSIDKIPLIDYNSGN